METKNDTANNTKRQQNGQNDWNQKKIMSRKKLESFAKAKQFSCCRLVVLSASCE